MSSLRKHAERELRAIGYDLKDAIDRPDTRIVEDLFELLDVFSTQWHSGASAEACVRMFEKLATYKPLSPLTGADNEWVEVSVGLWQNLRCSHVYKKYDQAYDIHGKVFRDKDGYSYTNENSRVYITFPYTPTTQYVDV